jgi:pimeloyl-ACP methyl ester carboxylesterase
MNVARAPLSPVLPDEPYPAHDADAKAREVVVGGERVRIVDAGTPGSPAVVLLHGWGGSAYNFRGVLPLLARSGFHAIAPDLRGHGWSDAITSVGAYSADAMARWVMALLDHLGVARCVLVGQSIGGAIALDAASLMGERIPALVLLAPIGLTNVRRVILARAPRWLRPSTTPRWVVTWILRRVYGTRGSWTERDADEYWMPLRKRAVVNALVQSAREFDFTPRDPRIMNLGDCRLVIRLGELDGLIPHRAAMDHARQFKGADVAVLSGVGHVPADEVPDEVVRIITHVASVHDY